MSFDRFSETVLAKTKGIRVNQLAKELGVASKAILDRCKAEGLGEKVPNHMTVMSLGLAETVREWFAGGGGGVAAAVETATEEAAAPRGRAPRRRKRTEDAQAPAQGEGGVETLEAPASQAAPATVVEAPPPPAEQPPPPTVEPVAPQAPQAVEPEAPPLPLQAPAPAPFEVPAAPAAPPQVEPAPAQVTEAAPQPAAPAPAPVTIAAEAPVVAEPAPAAPAAEAPPEKAEAAPTPTPGKAKAADRAATKSRGAPKAAEPARKTLTPAPRLVVPEPAKMQGPRVVREERPEIVAAPRRRTPGGEGTKPPVFVQARPQAGRGVRSTDDDADEIARKKAGKGARTLSARRRGPDGRRGEAMEKLREYTEADLIERRDRLAAASSYRAGFDSELKKKAERGQHQQAKSIVQKGQPVEVEEPITVRSLSAALGVKSSDMLLKLMRQGVMANVNQALDRTTAEALALDYGIELVVRQQATLEEQLQREIESRPVDPSRLRPRPPVVTILGHVDHGKTSLLDRIRKANVAAAEAGGITQHMAAWMVQVGERRVTFIDTPGHQAFTSMRARGAHMTDVVVLVVSAAEGVQPQTIESINHARAAEVPIVVALNKIDRPDANPDMVLGQLAKEGLNPVEWGGDTEVVRTSAITGEGVDSLIEVLDYQAELLELKADPTAPARGTVIDARVDEGRGAVATVLVQDGTLRVGDIMLCGAGYGRVRSLINDRGAEVTEAGPSTPVIVSGLHRLPAAGDRFYVVDDLERARAIAEEREAVQRQTQLAAQNRLSLDKLLASIATGESKIINLIIKADVQGSVETLVKSVTDQNTEEVKVRVIHAGVGPISESDVELAIATKAKPTDNRVGIIGFHVDVDESARALAEQHHVDIKLYRVIYEIFDDLKKALSGMLEPEIREKLHGHAEIRQVFKVSRVGNIAGCMVTDGHIQRGSKIRLIRNGTVVAQDLALESLKRVKDDVREVKAGLECGIKLAGYNDIAVGDRLEAYSRELIQRTL